MIKKGMCDNKVHVSTVMGTLYLLLYKRQMSIIATIKNYIRPLYTKLYVRPALSGTYGRYVRTRVIVRRWGMRFKYISLRYDQSKVDTFLEVVGQYKQVRIRRLWSERIGEYICRYINDETEAVDNDGTLYVYILSDYENDNKRLTEIMSRESEKNVIFANKEDRWSWLYLCLHDKRINLEERNIWCPKDTWEEVDVNFAKKHLKLSEQELVEGDAKSAKMGLTQPFVCVSNRDAAYITMLGGVDNTARNACTKNSLKAYTYLVKRGITCVRMGRVVCDRLELRGCIDYANEYYDELLDLYLSSRCKFFISAASGVMQYAISVGTPIVYTNDVDLLIGGLGGTPQSEENIIIFKHFYKKAEDRYLSIREMMDVLDKYRDSGRSLYKEGIELIENSPDEIYEAVKEMNERLDSVWIETPEDQELQYQYRRIVDQWHAEHGTARHNAFRGRVGANYLRNNRYLLSLK